MQLTTQAWSTLRQAAGRRLRSVVDASVAVGTSTTSAAILDLTLRIESLESDLDASLNSLRERLETAIAALERNELDVAAAVQRLEECLEFLRVQHELVRDVIERQDHSDRPV